MFKDKQKDLGVIFPAVNLKYISQTSVLIYKRIRAWSQDRLYLTWQSSTDFKMPILSSLIE